MAERKEQSEEIQRLLTTVCDHFDKEDRAVRERQIRQWKKLKYYWDGFHRLWWSEVAHDWRVYDTQDTTTQPNDDSFYDKSVNVFRAYLESIIAALSVTIPAIKCYPDDADNPLDISTAQAGDKIAELVAKHNNVSLLWLHALYIYCTEGMIAAYNYSKEDEAYGTYEENEYEDSNVEQYICPFCKNEIPDNSFAGLERDEYDPENHDVILHDILNQEPVICPTCASQVDPALAKEKVIITRLVGINKLPKSRQCIEVHGGLFIKVANYAQNQKDTPYLIYAYETHYANVLDMYPNLHDKIKIDGKGGSATVGGMYDPYERWGRLSTQYYGEYPLNTITVRYCWLRHSAFNILDKEDADKLKKLFPDGAKVVLVNDNFADVENENLDDHWTLTHNPLSDYLHHRPLGTLLTSVQEVTTDLISLVLQTIEHGIPQTFADPAVLNFEQYRTVEATPGMIFPAKPTSGRSIGDAFYEIKTATLSGEVLPFSEKIQEMGQLVSGALPSLFGGDQANSSKTAAQYSMSRSQAQQRLQNVWKMLCVWWKELNGKVIPAYIKDMAEDEHVVQKDKQGGFLNVFLRTAEMQGKIGSIELEANEELPQTPSQKRDALMQVLQSQDPMIMQAMISPENIPLMKDIFGVPDLVLPGEDDRQKQYEEIRELLNSEPIQIPGQPQMDPMSGQMMQGQPQEIPSVQPEQLVDNHEIEADICRRWLVSSSGRLAKLENPSGYKNILLHLQMHMMFASQAQMQAAASAQPPQSDGKAAQQGQDNG